MNPPQTNQTPETKSALLPVPRELRDCIYEYLLTDIFVVKTLWTGEPSSSPSLHWNPLLFILYVSKSTYEEAKIVLYKHGQFCFDAMSVYSPRLPEEIRNVPALEMLQDIYLEITVDRTGGWDFKDKFVESATTLLNYLAGVNSSVPRKRCVVETVSISALEFSGSSSSALIQLRDAICRLTGFQVVELKMWDMLGIWDDLAAYLATLFACLGEMLMTRLGKERNYGQENVRCIFYPQREQSRAAPG